MTARNKNASLSAHLSKLGDDEVAMSFAEVDRLVRLPRSAGIYPEWWANDGRNPRARGWRDAERQVVAVDLSDRRVRFSAPGGGEESRFVALPASAPVATEPRTGSRSAAAGRSAAPADRITTQRGDEPLVIVPCGSAKRSVPARADQLYTGGYHRACLDYALGLVPATRILILSGKYGLLDLDTVIQPYDVRMGRGITPDEIRTQAATRGLLSDHVIALGGRQYTSICRAIWATCETPLEGRGGLGRQLQWLRSQAP